MDEEDEVTGWLAGVFTLIALPSLALVALRLIAARPVMRLGLAILRCGHAIVRAAWWLNDR